MRPTSYIAKWIIGNGVFDTGYSFFPKSSCSKTFSIFIWQQIALVYMIIAFEMPRENIKVAYLKRMKIHIKLRM